MVSDNNFQDMTRSPLNYLDIFSHHNQDVGASRNKKQTEKGILINDNVAKGLFSREKHINGHSRSSLRFMALHGTTMI